MLRAFASNLGRYSAHKHFLNLNRRVGYSPKTRSFSMDHLRQSLEVIEDSEPERQEVWRRAREERMKAKHKLHSHVIEVIDLSDGETDLSPLPHLQKTIAGLQRGQTVISISDDSVDGAHAIDAQDIPPDTSPSTSTTSTSADSSSLSFDVKAVVDNILRNKEAQMVKDADTESEDESSAAFRNGIGRFAFSSKPSGSGLQPSRIIRTTSSSSVIAPPTKPTRSKPSQSTYLDFNEGQLSDLRKCVSCDIKWTTRKSVVQKITHIKTCAKKSLVTDDTLRLLITQEIEITQAEKMKSSKKAPNAVPKEAEVPKTFIEDVLQDGGIQKIQKTKKATSSLKRVTDNRDTILQKASSILGPQALRVQEQEVTMETSPSTQPLAPSKLASNASRPPIGDDPMPTQAFGQSALAGRFGRATTSSSEASGSHSRHFLSSAHQLPESLEPPPTQNFAPSRLGGLQRTHSLFHQDSSPSPIRNNADILMDADADGAMLDFAPGTPVNEFDDAILIYDPDAYPHPPRTPSPAKPKTKSRKRTAATPKNINLNSQAEEVGQNIEDEVELARQLKEMVLADETLHLRILRYEPIHFDVFMEMAKSKGINAVALKTKMRAFLDKQAISHYGNEPGGSRSRH
ncbi:hypothetical protein SCHPADRAFT_999058 [Schizopora paradoxa]|uniref:Structure-specific endonuclease subunit SLX4 n=1 Tax=Schizopora paradoxa TaxID=27342 RepID=A0A0H2RH72_9AGAM|nr:hypothetical protein SCHPADRAFT_999058 [Schizopora paradoxa]